MSNFEMNSGLEKSWSKLKFDFGVKSKIVYREHESRNSKFMMPQMEKLYSKNSTLMGTRISICETVKLQGWHIRAIFNV